MVSDQPRFYVLRSLRDGAHAEFLPADGTTYGNAVDCTECGHAIGGRRWLPPHRVELEVYGESLGDLLMGIGDDPLVSPRLVEAFRGENLTGLDVFHEVEVVEIVRKKPGPKITKAPKLFLANAAYGRAVVDEAQSKIRRRSVITCAECRSTGVDGIYGFYIDSGTWDGLDVFRPRGLSADIVVSARFKSFVEKHNFTNIQLVPTEEFQWDPLGKGKAEFRRFSS